MRFGIAHWIERDGAVWLVRRPAKGLLGGMAALPGGDWTDEPSRAAATRSRTVRHVFTHFALDLSVVRGAQPRRRRAGGSRSTRSTRPACRRSTARRCRPRLPAGSARGLSAGAALEEGRSPPVKGRPLLHCRLARAGTSWTTASTPSPAGSCSPGSSRSAASIVAGEVFHSERPEKMGYPIEGVVSRRRGRRRSRAADRFLSRQRRRRQGRAGVQEMRRLPQCRAGRRQRARPDLYGVMGNPVAGHAGLRLLSDALKGKGGTWDLGNDERLADEPEEVRAGHQDDLRRPRQPEDRANVMAFLNSRRAAACRCRPRRPPRPAPRRRRDRRHGQAGIGHQRRRAEGRERAGDRAPRKKDPKARRRSRPDAAKTRPRRPRRARLPSS